MNGEKPHKLITVVCACIKRNGGQQVLLAIRHAPGVPGLDGRWELPGGKIEFGETPDQALVREIREEIAAEIEPLRLLPYLHTNIWEYEHSISHVVLAGYECQMKAGTELTETNEVRWFDLDTINFARTLPGTQEFIDLAVQSDWLDRLCIKLESVDKAANLTKHFVIAAQPTLFSQYGLVKYSGAPGRHTRLTHEEFDSPRQMDDRIFHIVRGRLSVGYRITGVEGPANRYTSLEKVIAFAREKHAIADDAWVN
jgi:8-oxo-dGTP diphosphatase